MIKKRKKNTEELKTLPKRLYRDRFLWLMILPYLIWYFLFVLRPMWGIRIAFYDYSVFRGFEGSTFVGLENFKSFIGGPYFLRLLKNTIIINLYGLAFGFPAPILFAVLLNEIRAKRFKKSVQTISYMPHFISTVVVVGIVVNILSPSTGVVNIILEKLGMERIYFLMEPKYFRTILTVMHIWQSVGFDSIIYTSAISGIDQELYEACIVDGGGKLRQLWNITLPGITPTIVILLIMRIGSLVSVGFEDIILLYQPTTWEVADVISSYTYRTGLADGNYGLASAVGLFNSIVSMILVFTADKISKKLVGSGMI